MQMTLGDVVFPYVVGARCLDRIGVELSSYDPDLFLVVTDETVIGLHGTALLVGLEPIAPAMVLAAPSGEAMKSLEQVSSYLEKAIAARATRRSMVVAFGGGVPGNVAGLMAALLYRGVRLVHVPTTTMAAMDSVLSIKQAVNSRSGKNHIGAYYPPTAVYLDIDVLRTLPDRHLRSGLCETAKNGLAIQPRSLAALRALLAAGDRASTDALRWVLEDSLAAKSLVTARDSRERGAGLVLEYGHTIGHAVEFCDQRLRGPDALTHGEAVAIGMVAAARIAAAMGWLGREQVAAHEELAALLDVEPRLPAGVSPEDVMTRVRADNKRGLIEHAPDESPMVLLGDLGKPLGASDCPLVPVPMTVITRIVEELAQRTVEHQRTPVDRSLADCAHVAWTNALGRVVDDDTDFFDAGGSSLAAMEMLSALEAAYGLRLPLRTIFDHSRFEAFVEVVAERRMRMAAQQALA